MKKPGCSCRDPGIGSECHCALLRDFPGGFYGDLENAEYANESSLWCDCECHEPERDDYEESDYIEEQRRELEADMLEGMREPWDDLR